MTWDALQKEILEKMRHLLRPGVYIQVGRGASSLPYEYTVNKLMLHMVGQFKNWTDRWIRTFVFQI